MFFMGNGREKMQIVYDAKTNLLSLRLDDQKQDVINKRISEDIVLDLGKGDRIIGIEILDASKHLDSLRVQYPAACRVSVIPAKAGIQRRNRLDAGSSPA
jgi:uncharacterized protein YuzE